MKTQELTAVNCFHCGDACAEEHRTHDGHDFCCHGCEVVYDLLNEAGLCDYYDLSAKPGVKQRATIDEQRTELFDLPEVREHLVEFSEGGITRVRLHPADALQLVHLAAGEPAPFGGIDHPFARSLREQGIEHHLPRGKAALERAGEAAPPDRLRPADQRVEKRRHGQSAAHGLYPLGRCGLHLRQYHDVQFPGIPGR
ncbi:MAG: heavy metal translocating P-type ATPase metal-binding domain-containing protein [Flavobacteriales bacterium]|nr:heavy metal translocating P-type ATPase metal-binding domain-containing protein [Flavobacteriales bacterium]